MDEILNFLCDYGHVIAELVLMIIVLFVTIFKKKVKVNSVFESVLMVLPELISLAESKFSDGSEKYAFVFNKCCEILIKLTGESSDSVLSKYTGLIDSSIESILATPHKK